VTLSEEALVLYVKALSLLAKSMDIAGAWWARKNRGDGFGDPAMHRADAASTLAGTRINNVVQWVRNRFNEVLEKGEFVRLKLIEAQKRLPPDHPSHPDNHSVGSSLGSGTSADVVVSPGVSAEKLMYDRALEMSRTAAINELTGEDLSGCEIAYVTAIRMLEAVLENGEVPRFGQGKDDMSKDGDKLVLDAVQAEERQVVIKRESLPQSKNPTSADNPCSGLQHSQSAGSSSQEAGDSCKTSTDTLC
jgi:serine/threonine-protein kinase ULK/ATG1